MAAFHQGPAGAAERPPGPVTGFSLWRHYGWQIEHDQHLLKALLAQLEPDFAPPTWQAFQRLAAGEEPKAVAAVLGLSVNAVFLAKSNILKRLREAAKDMTD